MINYISSAILIIIINAVCGFALYELIFTMPSESRELPPKYRIPIKVLCFLFGFPLLSIVVIIALFSGAFWASVDWIKK